MKCFLVCLPCWSEALTAIEWQKERDSSCFSLPPLLHKLWLVTLTLLGLIFSAPSTHSSFPATSGGGTPSPTGMTTQQNTHHLLPTQDPSWLAKKNAHQIMRPGLHLLLSSCPSTAIQPSIVCGPPLSHTLYTSVVQNTVEPRQDHQLDALGHSYWDPDMYRLCGPGAVANTLYYWNNLLNTYGQHTFTDQYTTTTWNDTANDAYLMYLAWQVQPTGWTPGLMNTSLKPSNGVSLGDERTALNWEASGHNTSTYTNFFYASRYYGNADATSTQLNSDIKYDIGMSFVPVQVVLNALEMPNWSNNPDAWVNTTKRLYVSHSITIVGYDPTYYYYTDTCGQFITTIGGCGSNGNGSVNKVPHAQLWQALANDNGAWNW